MDGPHVTSRIIVAGPRDKTISHMITERQAGGRRRRERGKKVSPFINSFFPATTVTSTHLLEGHNSRLCACNPETQHKVLPFNTFITSFKVKWGARLNKLYLSITKHKSHFFISSTSSFFISPLSVPLTRFRVLSLRVTKKQFKLFITQLVSTDCVSWMLRRMRWGEREQHQQQRGRAEQDEEILSHHTYVSSHKSCFAELLFSVFFLRLCTRNEITSWRLLVRDT